ncbi:hypothetical protein HDZ31DRAFT_46473, partial [Schizophyllum fasciatum]
QFYSKLYYPTRVKSVFEAVFKAEVRQATAQLEEWSALGVDPPATWKRPQALPLRNKITAQCWAQETESFKDAVRHAHQQEIAGQKDAFKRAMESQDAPVTPEDFQRYLSLAALYLQPIMDALQSRLGMVATVFMTGPIPDDGGRLGVLSAHSGKTRGYNPQTFPEFDPEGLADFEKVLINFAKHVYNQWDQDIRATGDLIDRPPPLEQGENEDSDEDEDEGEEDQGDVDSENIMDEGGAPEGDMADSSDDDAPDESDDAESDNDGSDEDEDHDDEDADQDATLPPSFGNKGHLASAHSTTPLLGHADLPPTLDGHESSSLLPPTPPSTPTGEPTNGAESAFQLPFISLTRIAAMTTPSAGAVPPINEDPPIDEEPPPSKVPASGSMVTGLSALAVDKVDIAKGLEHDVWKNKLPYGCPPHIIGVLEACSRGQEWGSEFAGAVSAYLALERNLGFPVLNHGRLVLSGSIRPLVYRNWLSRKRPFSDIVDVGEPQAFGILWRTWWEAMQPPLRISHVGDLIAVHAVADEVTHLAQWGNLEMCCGRDGLLQFLITLVWWGDAVNDPDRRVLSPAYRLEWEMAVQDFREVLEAMMAAPDFKKIAKKRAQ